MTISSKLIWTVLLAAAGTCYVIYRKITSAVDKASTSGLINRLKKDPEKAKGLAEELDIPYGKRDNFSMQDFHTLRSALQKVTTIDDFIILYQTEVDAARHLVITEISFSDFDVDMTGKATDIKKKAYHFFVLKFDGDSNEFSVWSHLYADTTSKFQKEAFSKRIVSPLAAM